MGLIKWVREQWRKMHLQREAQDVFGVEVDSSSSMGQWITEWEKITSGNPMWLDPEDDVRSYGFAQFIDDITSGLVTLDLGINLPDGRRGEYLQKIANYLLQNIDKTVSEALGNAGIMFKPNGENIDYYKAGEFLPTEWDSNGNITGCMFVRKLQKGRYVYTKFEYHRYEMIGEQRFYVISNRAYVSKNSNSKGDQCSLTEVPEWAELIPDVYIEHVDVPLFAYYGNPKPNIFDRDTPLKSPIWGNCLEELRDLDIAFSRKSAEVEDSKHMTFVPQQAVMYADSQGITLPRFVKGLQMNSGGIGNDKVDEHVATLLTADRIADINSILALISSKLGFDQGFFVLNERTGAITATQVEADDQSTIRTIKNLRDPLRDACIKLLYGASVFADLYTDIPVESWTLTYDSLKAEISDSFHFGDITYSYEEDKASWWKYRLQGDVPAWMYYVKFEGMSEDEAKQMIEDAKVKRPTLFEEE